ncbi:SDR family NAD(P)-dependent oxidoreductase [Phaeovulum sp. W22_SRMD_FR3]|uniref:SDR family NAD(P)-dependent oxidoreductase n=1 Tax=Phaeovulum sp. W22_SRMD_FR3 TaxID=3240274 RepID=UPI003F996437
MALIAGAGDTGLGIARVLLRAGMRVQLTDNSVLRLSHAARSLPGPVGCHLADLRRNAQVECLAEEIVAQGGCDLLIHTPAKSHAPPRSGSRDPLQLSDADWQEPWESTFMSAMRTARALVPHMVRNGGGQVVFITAPASSAPVSPMSEGAVSDDNRAADRTVESQTAQAAAGAALTHFSQAIAAHYLARGVQFSTLAGPEAGDGDGFAALGAQILAQGAAQNAAATAVLRPVLGSGAGPDEKPNF